MSPFFQTMATQQEDAGVSGEVVMILATVSLSTLLFAVVAVLLIITAFVKRSLIKGLYYRYIINGAAYPIAPMAFIICLRNYIPKDLTAQLKYSQIAFSLR